MLISSMLIVGTIGIFRRYIPLSSALLAFFRGVIGGTVLCIFAAVGKRGHWQSIERKKLLFLVVSGAFLGINWILLFEAYNYTTIAKATLCYYLQPTIVLLLSPLLFNERLTAKKMICAASALAGMILVSGAAGGGPSQLHEIRGIVFGLGAACFYSAVVILNKKMGHVPLYEKTIVQLFSAAVILIPYLLAVGDPGSIVFDADMIILLLIVGVIYTGVVYGLYFGSMDGLRAQTISMLSYLEPMVAMAVSAFVLREPLSTGGIMGAVMILGSALVSEYEPGPKE
ncbi:MAG: EamA family transporter [Hungatella sp.]|nr:EamA family transporter [Hungatella sp.]